MVKVPDRSPESSEAWRSSLDARWPLPSELWWAGKGPITKLHRSAQIHCKTNKNARVSSSLIADSYSHMLRLEDWGSSQRSELT